MSDDHIEPQLVPNQLLQVSTIELHNSLGNDPKDVGIKDARDEDDNNTINDSNL